MIINQRQDFFSTKIEIQIMPDLPFYNSVLCFFLSFNLYYRSRAQTNALTITAVLKLAESVAKHLYYYSFSLIFSNT